MSEHQSTLGVGQIQFHQWCEPPLESGDYTVAVTQTVDELKEESNPKGEYSNLFDFTVAGPRFSLNPSEIYSVYPPKGHIGDFANSLPHIIFTRRTLPWERSLTPGQRTSTDRLPWMAVLVFSEQDFKTKNEPDGTFPEVKSLKVSELINPGPNADFVGPNLGELAAHESLDDLCQTIDLPGDLFKRVAPSEKDLSYLAHVREVNTGDKETLSFLADGWFSVVLANRFPQPEIAGTEPPLAVENRAFLVSLEGMKEFLPLGSASTANKNVRLAVLSSWNFHCRKAFTFKALMNALDVRRLAVPWPGAAVSDTEKQVSDAWEMGYTALNHSTRLGEKTVSWYRGPLVPLFLSKKSKYQFRPAADAALRYSPIDGMMDVTYAAAFQLGRLLGLQDRNFATALYAYRNNIRRQIKQVMGKKQIQSVLGQLGDGEENELMNKYLSTLDAASAGSKQTGWVVKEFEIDTPVRGDENPRREKPSNSLNLTTDFNLTIPKNICTWLAKLMLLYRVPFLNLVPDERMLPPDSMRFFYLDPGWLKCLMEGACSVGRSSSRDELVDEHLRDNFLKLAIDQSPKIRTRTLKQGADAAEPLKVSETGPAWPDLTGFLIRSPLVDGWQGLEMRAWKNGVEADENLLHPLRIDRLAPDIMLCIFNGKVEQIEIKQPPEGMHFGATSVGDGFKRFNLRRLNTSSANKSGPGDQLKNSEIDIPLRNHEVKRVVDVSALAETLKKKIDAMDARDATQEFTSADFGVEMVESPGRVIFNATN